MDTYKMLTMDTYVAIDTYRETLSWLLTGRSYHEYL